MRTPTSLNHFLEKANRTRERGAHRETILAGICSTLSTNNAGAFLVEPSPDYSGAGVRKVPGIGVGVDDSFLDAIRNNTATGIILVEGRTASSYYPLTFEIRLEGEWR